MKLVRLTLERDCVATQDKTATNNNNNETTSDVASAADDRDSCCTLADLSVTDDGNQVSRSPLQSATKNVKRRSTVPKGSVTVCLSVCLSVSPFHSHSLLFCV